MHMEEGFREGQPRGSGSAGSAHASSHVCVHVQAGLSQAPSVIVHGKSRVLVQFPVYSFLEGGGRKEGELCEGGELFCVSGIPY